MRLAVLALGAGVWLSACSNPLDEVERLSDVTLADDAGAAAIAAAPEAETVGGGGFLSGLLGLGARDDMFEAAADAPQPEPAPEDAAEGEESGATTEEDSDEAPRAEPETDAEPAPAGGGLFGFLRENAGQARNSGPAVLDGPDGTVIPAGLQLPYGEIATVCDLPNRDRGSQVGREAGFTLYDTSPSSQLARNFYITGFPDRCTRQFTGTLVLLGSAEMHEAIRYSAGTRGIDYTETDVAYEEIKGRICGASAGDPCGNRIDALSRRLVFVTVYPRFGSSSEWVEILLFDGEVVAIDTKSV